MSGQTEKERLAVLETEMGAMKTTIGELEKKVSYYDRVAVKWGGFLMGVTALAAAISMGAEKLRDKLITAMWP